MLGILSSNLSNLHHGCTNYQPKFSHLYFPDCQARCETKNNVMASHGFESFDQVESSFSSLQMSFVTVGHEGPAARLSKETNGNPKDKFLLVSKNLETVVPQKKESPSMR